VKRSLRFLFSNPLTTATRAAIFLDRDGVINRRIVGGYVCHWTQFKFVPGIKDALSQLSRLSLPMIVVSNQAGVAKGLVSQDSLREITERFVAALTRAGSHINAVYYCPHDQYDNCRCRKPHPGLLEQAAADWRLDLASSVLIGDSLSDVQAANAAGCPAILLLPRGTTASRSLITSSQVEIASRVSRIPELVRSRFASTQRLGPRI